MRTYWYAFSSINYNYSLLPITFANSLNPDQARQNAGPDLDQNCFDTDGILFEKFDFEKTHKKPADF